MRLGIIVRAEDRGLGIQTWEAWRHLNPAKTLLIDTSMAQQQFPVHYDRYPGATHAVVADDGDCLDEYLVKNWLEGLDVVFSCESLYDPRFPEWARAAGCKTVIQMNPEFIDPNWDRPPPDAWWNPTTWRMEHLPSGTRHVPVPVALDRFASRESRLATHESRVRFLHPVGKPATADRAGTETLLDAIQHCPGIDITIASQELVWDASGRVPANLSYRIGNVDGYWNTYTGFDVVVLPRRYGGLSLPTQEAMAAGCAVVMPDCSPNMEMWPVIPLRSEPRNRLDLPCGPISIAHVEPMHLAQMLRHLQEDPQEIIQVQNRSRQWAADNSWESLLPLYEREFQRVLDPATVS